MQEDTILIMGDVDCGKSSLLGKLLLAEKKEINRFSQNVSRGDSKMSKKYAYAQVTDSLDEEILQHKTINTTSLSIVVAGKKYTFMDTPGHQELVDRLLNNLIFVSGVIVMVDIDKGVTEYLRVLLRILQLFKIDKVAVIVNKLDLVFSKQREERFLQVRAMISGIASDFNLKIIDIIGVSVEKGWNIFDKRESLKFYGHNLVKLLKKISQQRILQREDEYTGLIIQDIYEKKFLKKNKLIYVGRSIGDKFFIQNEKVKVIHLKTGKKIILNKPVDINGRSLKFFSNNEVISFNIQVEKGKIRRGDVLVVAENNSNIVKLKYTSEIKIQGILPLVNNINNKKGSGRKIKKEINAIRSGKLQIGIAGQNIWGSIQKVLFWERQGDLIFFSCLIKLKEKIVWTPYFYQGVALGYGIACVENLNIEGVFFCCEY